MGLSCGACDNQPEGIYLCPGCRDRLIQDLEIIPATVDAIWASAARMDVGNGTVGSSGHKTASEPTNARAYDVGRTLNVILTGWADTLGYREPHAVKAAAVLLTHIREVRAAEWAPDLKRELREVLWQADTVTDRRASKVFAGICATDQDGEECGTPLYALQGKPEAKCPSCRALWDVTDWRKRAMVAAGPATATAAELSRILSDPTRALVFPQNKIAVWVSRKVLRPIGYRADGRAVYQVRKVWRLWEKSLVESEVRKARAMARLAA